MNTIDTIEIVSDENGWELVLHGDFTAACEEYLDERSQHTIRLNMQGAAFEFGNSPGLADLLDWCSQGNVARAQAQRNRDDEDAGFEGVGDFTSDDPYERFIAHQAAKGNL